MITKRDLGVAVGAAVLTVAALVIGGGAVAQAPKPSLIGPSVFTWQEMKPHDTDVGTYAQVMKGPTATLEELELHVTTLKPGTSSHPPHEHPNEELVIIREGQVETLSDGVWKKVGPGGVIFNASNSPHALRNIGTTNAVYHVINWKGAKAP
jgi:quercetin dioxygenase-like cupin family protein